MQIKEVEELLQISSFTLRYYERMQLVQPTRDENGYRNYTKEDIEVIKKIKFLRELEIPIEDISTILIDSTEFQTVLEQHLKKVNTQIKSLEYIQKVCQGLKEKNISLLDAMINEEILDLEKIDKNQVKEGLKKVIQYLKPIQTVVIGRRVDPRNYLKGVVITIVISILCGFTFGIGIPNTINTISSQFSKLAAFTAGIGSVLICTLISFMIIFLFIARGNSNQEYIELTDTEVSICSKQFQSRVSIFMGMLLKQSYQRNRNYTYLDLLKVEVNLMFSTTSGGYSGLWNIYVPKFIFYFKDGTTYTIDAGLSFGEKVKESYGILRQKNIEIIGDAIVMECFEQNDKKQHDFFEEHYHLNSKK